VAEWMAFAGLEGMPDVRADFGFGQICATLANVHRREGQDAYRADDFMPALRGAIEPKAPAHDVPPEPEAHSRLISALLGKKE
jgi:hypothetical protein